MMTADEAVTDIVDPYKDAGRAFYELWTDPDRAWEKLHSGHEDEYGSDVGGTSADHIGEGQSPRLCSSSRSPGEPERSTPKSTCYTNYGISI